MVAKQSFLNSFDKAWWIRWILYRCAERRIQVIYANVIIASVPFVNYLYLRGGNENMSVYIVKCCPAKPLEQHSALRRWSFQQSSNGLLCKTLTYQISEIASYGLDPCLQNDVTSAAQTAPRVCRRNLILVRSALTQLLWHWKSTGSMWMCTNLLHCSLHYFRLPLITLKTSWEVWTASHVAFLRV